MSLLTFLVCLVESRYYRKAVADVSNRYCGVLLTWLRSRSHLWSKSPNIEEKPKIPSRQIEPVQRCLFVGYFPLSLAWLSITFPSSPLLQYRTSIFRLHNALLLSQGLKSIIVAHFPASVCICGERQEFLARFCHTMRNTHKLADHK